MINDQYLLTIGKSLMVLMLTGSLLIIGCEQFQPPQIGPRVKTNLPPAPPYAQVVAKYNANLEKFDHLWCRATVQMQWEEADGKMRTEQGDSSQLMAVLPDELALSVGKLGQALVWIGADAKQYWFIDLSSEPKSAHIGRHEHFERHRAMGQALMIRPHDVPKLAGWVQLPLTPSGRVTTTEAGYVIEPASGDQRVTVDPKTTLPVKIELLDPTGRVIVMSTLNKPDGVETEGTHIGAWPRINRFVELTSPMTKGWLRLHLSDMTDARGQNDSAKRRAMKRAFDFDYLVKAMRVEVVDDLDRFEAPAPLMMPTPHKHEQMHPIAPETSPPPREDAKPQEPQQPQWHKPQPVMPLSPDDGTSRSRTITIPPIKQP